MESNTHPHLRSYVGQARVALHSAVRQLELAAQAFESVPSDSGLSGARADVNNLLERLRPLGDVLADAHAQVVQAT